MIYALRIWCSVYHGGTTGKLLYNLARRLFSFILMDGVNVETHTEERHQERLLMSSAKVQNFMHKGHIGLHTCEVLTPDKCRTYHTLMYDDLPYLLQHVDSPHVSRKVDSPIKTIGPMKH
jgi:hypothetical protein